VLIGQGINYLPYFLLAFKELGGIGIGRGRKKFSLGDVYAVNPVAGSEALVYSSADEGVRNENLNVGFAEIAESAQKLPSDGLTVRYVKRPEFHVLFRNALRRLSSLYYFHCGERWDTDYKGLIDAAQGVVIAEAETEWVAWERYSWRKGRRMDFGGFIGTVRYEGDLRLFLPVILAGELVHVGKACVFGNGRYEVWR
jgi:hypothetical protein